MLKITIIDDEPKSLEFIVSLVDLYVSDCTVIGAYTDPQEGLEAILKQSPDLLLLDIDMPGMTGFELLKKIPIIDFDIIFITAYNQYAIEAFKHYALAYLLKPVQPDEFVEAIERSKKRKAHMDEFDDLKSLKETLIKKSLPSENQNARIALATQKTVEFIQLKNIIHIVADRTYSTFHLVDKKKIVVSKNIGYYKDLDNYDIMRCQKSHMVNLVHAVRYIYGEHTVEMIDDSKIPVSDKAKDKLIQRLTNL